MLSNNASFTSLLEEVDRNDDPKKYFFIPTKREIRKWFEIINTHVFCGRLYATFGHIEIRRRHGVWAEYSGWIDPRRSAAGKCKILQELAPFRLRPDILGRKVTICGKLSITNRFPTLRVFIEVLAHEMVHLYQFLYAQPAFSIRAVSHGKTFHAWKPIFKANGLSLKVSLHFRYPKASKRTQKEKLP